MDIEDFLMEFSGSSFYTLSVSSGESEIYLRKTSGGAVGKFCKLPEPDKSSVPAVESKGLFAQRVGHYFPKVKVGDSLEDGQVFGHIKAMNIMHEIRSTRSGKVIRIPFTAGDAVEYGDLLVELEDK